MREYKCRVCGKKFRDLFIHLHKNEEKLLKELPTIIMLRKKDIKPSHLKEYKEIEDFIDYKLKTKKKCFCGGEIIRCRYSSNEYSTPTVICSRCRFLW